jgi:hypothetical protein
MSAVEASGPLPDPIIVVKKPTPKEFADAIDESELITQLKDLRGQYEALVVPDPHLDERIAISLKMQAIRERLASI